jgi:hypothetical protein
MNAPALLLRTQVETSVATTLLRSTQPGRKSIDAMASQKIDRSPQVHSGGLLRSFATRLISIGIGLMTFVTLFGAVHFFDFSFPERDAVLVAIAVLVTTILFTVLNRRVIAQHHTGA